MRLTIGRSSNELLVSSFKGPSEEQIARVTGYSAQFVSQIGARLKESGLWTSDGTDYQEWDPTTKMGLITFVMDLAVAEGRLLRTGAKRNGKYIYRPLMCGCDPVN